MRLPRATIFSVGCWMLAWAAALLLAPQQAGAETSGPAGVDGYFVTANYRSELARNPDPVGWLYWKGVLDSGYASDDQVVQAFLTCQEYEDDYGSSLTDSQFLADLFQDAYGRQPTGDESSYWLGLLSNGSTRSYVAGQIIASAEFDADHGAYAASYYTAYTDPMVNGMSPTQATVGTEQPFTLSFSNAYGSSDVFSGSVQMDACVFTWCIQSGCNSPNELGIGSSYGQAGQSGTLVGSACSITLQDSSFAATQAGYNIDPALTFSSGFTGQRVWAMSTSKVWALGSVVAVVTTQSLSFGTLTVN